MSLNAVERRLLDLRHHWEAFTADPEPRLLVWTSPDAAARLVRCFFAAQKHEGEYVTGDLFIHFDAPFEHSIQYSRALKHALVGQYAASRDDLAQQGLGSRWDEAARAFPDSAYGFIQALRSFGGAYHATIGHLVAVLAPASVAKPAHFSAWLARALDAGLPERLRLVTVDSLEAPRLADLQAASPALVRREILALDATAVATETFAQERTTGPAGVFRNLLMALVALVEKASAAQVELKAADALAYARAQGWKNQEAVVLMLVAGAQLKEQRFDAANAAYRDARAAAALAGQEGHPAGHAMVLQTWFGEAGVELAAGRVADAAAAYDRAAVVAQEASNVLLGIEAFRMAAFCHARLGEQDAAIERGGQALALGERLRAEARMMTTLPIAAADLLRVISAPGMQAIEAIQKLADQRGATLAAALEEQAASCERATDTAVFRSAEETLARGAEALARRAELELGTLVAGTDAPFQQAFARARGVLGQGWPLTIAVPFSSPAPAVAEQEPAAT